MPFYHVYFALNIHKNTNAIIHAHKTLTHIINNPYLKNAQQRKFNNHQYTLIDHQDKALVELADHLDT